MDSSTPIRVVLWSPSGAGLHYHGPGQAMHRLYRSDGGKRFSTSLVHGYVGQADVDGFNQIFNIGNFSPALHRQLTYLWPSHRWIRRNARHYDVFHGANAYSTTVQAAVWAEQSGLPSFVRVTAYESDLASLSRLSRLLGMARRRRSKVSRLSGVIAISRAIEQELLRYGIPEGKIFYLPNAVDCVRFAPAKSVAEKEDLRRKLGFGTEPIVAFCGGLVRRKRPHLVIEALTHPQLRAAGVRAVFFGAESDPSYYVALQRRAAELGVSESIRFLGHRDDVEQCLRAADLFVLPSRNEGMSNALIEAMASGLTPVVTPVSGTSDVVSHGENGWILRDDGSDLAEAIDFYIADDAIRVRHGAAARNVIESRLSTTLVLERYRTVFNSVLSGAR